MITIGVPVEDKRGDLPHELYQAQYSIFCASQPAPLNQPIIIEGNKVLITLHGSSGMKNSSIAMGFRIQYSEGESVHGWTKYSICVVGNYDSSFKLTTRLNRPYTALILWLSPEMERSQLLGTQIQYIPKADVGGCFTMIMAMTLESR